MRSRRQHSPVPALSVIVPTIGMYDVLARVLDGYDRQRAAAGTFELILVSDRAEPDASAVDTAIGDRTYPVRRIAGAVPGASANRNAGLRAATAPLVLFTDNDTIPVPSLVAEHLSWHARHAGEEVGVLGHVRWAPELEVTAFMRWLDRGIQFDYPSIEGIEAGWGRFYSANVSVKRAFADRVGGFDQERLPYGYEDLDWGLRADRLGLRLLYNRRAIVDHLRPMTLELWRSRVRRIAHAERRFCQIHPHVPPYFHERFSAAARCPPARGRGVPLARWIPPELPWLGPKVWGSTDLYFRQALAPHFLEAWEEPDSAGPSSPDLAERSDLSASHPSGSSPGGPK